MDDLYIAHLHDLPTSTLEDAAVYDVAPSFVDPVREPCDVHMGMLCVLGHRNGLCGTLTNLVVQRASEPTVDISTSRELSSVCAMRDQRLVDQYGLLSPSATPANALMLSKWLR